MMKRARRMSAKIKTREWDVTEYLRDEEDIRLYIEAAMEEAPNDAAFMSLVLGDVARARNVAELARTTGIARETLYKVLRGEGNPTLGTVSSLANALGFRLSLVPMAAAAKPTAARAVAKAVTKVRTHKRVAGKRQRASSDKGNALPPATAKKSPAASRHG
jgi:probable addiction module antidote protein